MAEVGEIYPGTGERVVGKVKNPDGPGYWLQGEYGGVFAEGGAPFLGSYFSEDMLRHHDDPNRRFSGIEAYNGGYRSITAGGGGTGYEFAPQRQGANPAPTPAPLTPAQQRAADPFAASAKGELVATLTQYGLPASLADRLWDEEYINKGTPIGTITAVVLPNTTEFKARFPGMTALTDRRNKGEAVIVPSVAQYLELENGISQVMRDAGLPPGAFDEPGELATFIGGSVSPKEVADRIATAKQLLYETPVETRMELARVYDMDEGEAIAWILNPEVGQRESQKRIQAAGLGGASRRSGFGMLTQAEMEQLAGSNITEAAAGQRLGELTQIGEGLFAETIEEAGAGEDLNRETQISYAAGNAQAESQMNRRRQRRAAGFQGGGGAAGGSGGRTGLG